MIRVFAPATIANVSCGYDILGLALHEPGDEVEMQLTETRKVTIESITGDDGLLPKDPAKNTVSAVVINYLKAIGKSEQGVSIKLHKQMPIGSGLGSSAASTVAGLFAINELMDRCLTKKELMPFAMGGEALACGSGHADNVAPALYGGFVLIRSYSPLDLISLPTPRDLICVLIHPKIEVKTSDARKILHKNIALKDAVEQWGNVAGLISGLYEEDYELISRSLQDKIVEPSRAILIPDFYPMKAKAMNLGALGFGISGSGPTVFAFTKNQDTATDIKLQLQQHLKGIGIASEAYISKINAEGPKIISKNF